MRPRALGGRNPQLAKVTLLLTLALIVNALVATIDNAGAETAPTVPPTPDTASSPATTYRLTPRADATVISSSPNTNYGTDNTLEAHNPSPTAHVYLRFSLPPLDGPIVAARLWFYPEASTSDGFSVRPASDTSWDESSITYANAPSYGGVAANSGALTEGVWASTWVDVTSLPQTAGSGPVSFVLTTGSSAKLLSREGGHSPRLVVFTTPPPELLSDSFDTPNGPSNLITNEYALWNLSDPLEVRSPNWQVTSGSLFSQNGVGWTGVPDDVAPDRYSTRSTGSSVFRMRTIRSDFPDNLQSVEARINAFHSAPSRPAVAWDGVVLWPRYVSPYHLYFAYLLRKDGRIAITKKCPGGDRDPDNPNYYSGGTYYTLTEELYYAPTVVGKWYQLATSAVDNADGSVTITLYRGADVVAQATDTGVGCAPINAPTKLGLRADNVDANFARYNVTALP